MGKSIFLPKVSWVEITPPRETENFGVPSSKFTRHTLLYEREREIVEFWSFYQKPSLCVIHWLRLLVGISVWRVNQWQSFPNPNGFRLHVEYSSEGRMRHSLCSNRTSIFINCTTAAYPAVLSLFTTVSRQNSSSLTLIY